MAGRVMPVTEEDIQRWRERAEECRSLAETFNNAIARGEMRAVADMYERMVEDAERILRRPRTQPKAARGR